MGKSYTLLIVDDSKTIVHYLIDILNHKEHNLLYTYSKSEAKKIMQKNDIDILICDLFLPERKDGLETIHFFKEHFPKSQVLAISDFPELENVIAMIKEGADDFISKTATKTQIIQKIEELKRNLISGQNNVADHWISGEQDLLVGKSKAIEEIRRMIKRIAENEVETTLIEGESGTGKELVAKTIHRLSPRRRQPFIALNCAGIPENLIDSELFGFERGSFTGAYATTLGKLELANRGVLFLDEISEMPLHLQSKFLRVLEDRSIYRIGGQKAIPVDTMIIAATNQNLVTKIREGKFREDIFFRLELVKIEIPPLRERKEDIPYLVEYFLKKISKRLKRKVTLSARASDILMSYQFPGNVRELKNILFHSALFCKDNQIRESNVIAYIENITKISKNLSSNSTPSAAASDDVILEVLARNAGNITRSARELGYTREGLSRRLKKMGVDIRQFRSRQ